MTNNVNEELDSIRRERTKIEARLQPDKWDHDLHTIRGERMKLDELEREIIWRLRLDEGESWSDIGHRLGTSKQAAWERFGKPFPTQGGLAPGPEGGD